MNKHLRCNAVGMPWDVPVIPFDERTIVSRDPNCRLDFALDADRFFPIDPITLKAIHAHSLHERWRMERDAAERENRPMVSANYARPIKWVGSGRNVQSAYVPRPVCGDTLSVHQTGQGWIVKCQLEADEHKPTILTHLPTGYPVLAKNAGDARQLAHDCYRAPPEGLRHHLGWTRAPYSIKSEALHSQ